MAAKSFLVGLAVGVPAGMLLGDVIHDMRRGRLHRRTREWMEKAHEKTLAAAERIREAVAEDLRKAPGNAGRNLADVVDRQAEQARQSASAQTERATLNRVSRGELLGVYGIGPVLADRVLEGRPYRNDREVVERGILNENTFEQLRRQVLEKYRKTA